MRQSSIHHLAQRYNRQVRMARWRRRLGVAQGSLVAFIVAMALALALAATLARHVASRAVPSSFIQVERF